jgi:hypothetical protein
VFPALWYPDDDEDRRWLFSDGLSELLGIISLHLFQEARWRETGSFQGREWSAARCTAKPPKRNDSPQDHRDDR